MHALTRAWIMIMLVQKSEEMLAETTSSLCFSITHTMVESRPGLRAEHTLMWASSPATLSTTFGEDQVRKDCGIRGTDDATAELDGAATGQFLAWSAKRASLVVEVVAVAVSEPVPGGERSTRKEEEEGASSKAAAAPPRRWIRSSFCCWSLWSFCWRALMYFTASSTIVDLSAYRPKISKKIPKSTNWTILNVRS